MEPQPPGAVDDPERLFVGREPELVVLRTALTAALAGRGRLVLLGGEPGVGKTRLAAEVAAEAGARGVPVWWGRTWEDGTAPPFWPWNAALRHRPSGAALDAALAAAGGLATELAPVFPALRDRLPDPPAAPEWTSDQARFRLFDIVSRFVAAVARPAGLLLVLDDLQWADTPSLRLLEFVAADLAHARILVVATYRDTEVQRGHPAFKTVSHLARETGARHISLTGLTPEECGRLVEATEARCTAARCVELHRQTNGNPFFLVQLVRLLGADRDRRRLPPGVRDVVSQRVDRLGGVRPALAVAALLGARFDVTRLDALLRATDPAPRVPTVDVVARAVRNRLLVPVRGRAHRYAFAHALVRYALIDELDPSERALWHGRIAEHLEASTDGDGSRIAVRLVRHFVASGSPAHLRKAFDHARIGAREAERGLGWEEAARLYAIALDAYARCGARDLPEGLEVRLALARALGRSGDLAGARARCRRTALDCRQAGRTDLLARAALLLAELSPGDAGIAPEARVLLEEVAADADDLDDALRARIYARLARDLVTADDAAVMDRAVALSAEAVRAARRAGSAGALAAAQSAADEARRTARPCGADSNEPDGVETLRLAEAAGDLELAAQIRHDRIIGLLSMGEAVAFEREVETFAVAAAATRVPEALWIVAGIGAMRAMVEGRFADGRRLSEEALEHARRMQLSRASGAHLAQQIMWHALQGRLADMAASLGDAIDARPELAAWRPFLAVARLASGDAVHARSELECLMAGGLAHAERGAHAASYLAGLAALCVGLRDRERAPMLYERVSRRPERWVVTRWATFGPWALAQGSLARLCDRPAAAAAHFEEAIRYGRRMRSRPVVAHAQTLLASTWLSADPDAATRERAAEMLREAEAAARELGLVDALARVERWRAACARPRPASSNVLRREGDVWTVGYAGTEIRLRDAKGLGYLATLVAAPGREMHVFQLASAAGRTASFSAASNGVPAGLSIGGLGRRIDDAPDDRARREYRSRLRELRAELDEAERLADVGRAGRLRLELELLVGQLDPRLRTSRAADDPAERARKAVTKALRTQIGKLLYEHPELGRHLSRSVRMGTFCVYAPATRVEWEV